MGSELRDSKVPGPEDSTRTASPMAMASMPCTGAGGLSLFLLLHLIPVSKAWLGCPVVPWPLLPTPGPCSNTRGTDSIAATSRCRQCRQAMDRLHPPRSVSKIRKFYSFEPVIGFQVITEPHSPQFVLHLTGRLHLFASPLQPGRQCVYTRVTSECLCY